MGAPLLTTSDTIKCPHGGIVALATSNTGVRAGGSPVLLETDIHTVAGCPFTIGTKPSPCVRIQWSVGSALVKINRVAPLLQTSLGFCYSAESLLQGVALIAPKQQKAKAI